MTDRNGRNTDFTYNDLGLTTSEIWRDAAGDRTISWTYDDAARLKTASDPDSSYAYGNKWCQFIFILPRALGGW